VHFGLEGYVPMALWLAEMACFLLSVFWRPTIGLYLLIPMLPLQTVRYRIHGFFLGDQFVDLLLLGIILGLKRLHRPIFAKTPLTALVFAYMFYTYLSLYKGSLFLGTRLPLWFDDQRLSDWKNYVVAVPLIFFVTISAIRTKRQMVLLFVVMCFGCVVLARGLHNTVGGRDFSTFSDDIREGGAMGYVGANGMAALTAQFSVFLIGLLLVERRFLAKIGYFGVIITCVYCLTFALSRGGYAAFLIGILYFGMARSRWLLVGLVLFLIGWQSVVPPVVRQRVLMTTDEYGNVEHSAAARLSLWDEAMEVFKGDPIFGTGFNTYAYTSHVGGYSDTHNVFVKVLVETGLLGLFLFLAIFRKLFQIGFRLHRTATDPFVKSIGLGFSGLMLAALVANLFGDRWSYVQISGYTYALAALAFRGQQLTDEADSQKRKAAADGTEAIDVEEVEPVLQSA
jgi:putative inorganic carbon (HCO3(-)) transporter